MAAIEFREPKDVINRINELREAWGPTRAEITAKEVLGLAYANGRQWTTVNTRGHGTTDGTTVESWDEDWDPSSNEIRVTDNRIGPLIRRVGASTNATKIRAAVRPPVSNQTMEKVRQARVAQAVLDGIGEDCGFTRVARVASSFRWKAGSAIIFMPIGRSTSSTGDQWGGAEYEDSWIRWEFYPMSDLILDAGNLNANLEEHDVVAIERIMTARRFEQVYGPLEKYGIKADTLPTLGDLAPHKTSTSSLIGTSFFQSYARQSREKAVRMITHFEGHPRDRGYFPLMFDVVDTTPGPIGVNSGVSGNVINWDNPENPYGCQGLPMMKLDAFRRDDSPWPFGLSHVLMGPQDITNITQSIRLQNLIMVPHGYWLVDRAVADRDTFATQLGEGVGSILSYSTRGLQGVAPPQFVHPNPPGQEFTLLLSELNMTMRDSSHLSPLSMGIGKSHQADATVDRLLQEGGAVHDMIVNDDVESYSRMLGVTLGTVRKMSEQPNRMLARLRDRHGFKRGDLETFLDIDPMHPNLDMKVRRSDITMRSEQERANDMAMGLQLGAITPVDYALSMTQELERPLSRTHEMQVSFIERLLVGIAEGNPYQGLPSLDFQLFDRLVKQSMWALDMTLPEDRKRAGYLEKARIIQQQLALEGMGQAQAPMTGESQMGRNAQTGALNPASLLGSGSSGGPPESINPLSNPSGAAGGLPAGLG